MTSNDSTSYCIYSSLALLDLVDEEILVMDPKGYIVTANSAFCRIRGLDRKEICNCPAKEILQGEPGGPDGPESSFSQALAGQTVETKYTVTDLEGRARAIRLTVIPLPVPDEEHPLIAEIRRDVTRTRHMKRQLEKSERLAAIGELSSYVAHEIRNPLFMISGFANSLLRDPLLQETAREKVNIIIEQSKRLDDILASFSDFVRPTTAKVGETDAHEVIRNVLEIAKQQQKQQTADGSQSPAIQIQTELSEDLPLVLAQSERLKQILINVVNNAFEAMPQGGKLTITTGLDREMASIKLSDSGLGIPEELLSNVFNPFFSTKEKGAGLGLPQSRKMLDEMGGEIVLQSTPGKGTTVTVRLPPVPAESE
ncbi:MAG: two-component system sensor histidine kinase NtrB [Desulfovibrio sp.]|uniref:two-component system sensor histidine kinase NtrB n=1 Tax=Desulfovibrio sp. 7SRBS1 TaxID=3378064 RepID=UPI003B41F230